MALAGRINQLLAFRFLHPIGHDRESVPLWSHTHKPHKHESGNHFSPEIHTMLLCYPITTLFYSINQGCRAGSRVMNWTEFGPSPEQLQGSPVDKCNLFWCHSPPPAEHSGPPGKCHSVENHHSGCISNPFLFFNKKPKFFVCSHPGLIKCYEAFLCTTFLQTRKARGTVLHALEQ